MKTVLKTKTLEDELVELQNKIHKRLFRIEELKHMEEFVKKLKLEYKE